MPFKEGRREGVGDGVIRETSLPGQTLYSGESCPTIRVFITASEFLFCQVNRSPGQDVSPLSKLQKSSLWAWGSSVVNKAEIDVFLELSCFFDDSADVGNLKSGSSRTIQKRSS